MPRGPEVPLWKRHVAGAYIWQLGMSQHQVAARLNISRSTLGSMLLRAKADTHGSEDLATLMRALEVKPRSGRPEKAPPGPDLSHLAREAVQDRASQPPDPQDASGAKSKPR